MRPGRQDQSCGVGIAWPAQGWRALPKRKSAVARHPPRLSGFRGSLMSVCLGGSGSRDAPPRPAATRRPLTPRRFANSNVCQGALRWGGSQGQRGSPSPSRWAVCSGLGWGAVAVGGRADPGSEVHPDCITYRPRLFSSLSKVWANLTRSVLCALAILVSSCGIAGVGAGIPWGSGLLRPRGASQSLRPACLVRMQRSPNGSSMFGFWARCIQSLVCLTGFDTYFHSSQVFSPNLPFLLERL